MKHIALFVGTRPEAIKLAPIVAELKRRRVSHTIYCVTQQTMVTDYLVEKDIIAACVTIKRTDGSLSELIAETTNALRFLAWQDIRYAIVQGDTTTAMCAALVAYMHRVPVVHVEAGLRSYAADPFPEDVNRRIISELAAIHFAPTSIAAFNLEKENYRGKLFTVGNTGIDAFREALTCEPTDAVERIVAACGDRSLVLLTCHRRENWDQISALVEGLKQLAEDCYLVWPCHPNPVVRKQADELREKENISVIDPLAHGDLCHLLMKAAVIVTDSGGMIEEACEAEKPCFVLRDVTERPEALDDGCFLLRQNAWSEVSHYIKAARIWTRKSKGRFGDGTSAKKIVDVLV